jgi:murein DD-endopeptidase MepM/ murein hydrolase activator NlpD
MQVGEMVLVGLPVSQPLGQLSLSYTVNNEQKTHHFEVVDKQYTEQHITLKNREMVNPKPKQLERIRRESKVQKALYQQVSPAQDLQQGFILPLQGITTSLFGHRRFFNGEARNPHSGLDIAAATGTPIIAPADAKVVLVDDLYFNGKAVFLDHGQGLITMYCHMSSISVEVGQAVEKGQYLGGVGKTGRVTGAHLHWSVSLNNARVNPGLFLNRGNTP